MNKYAVGTAIFSIFLLAIFGIQEAFSWLRQSPRADETERIVAIEDDSAGNRASDDFTDRVSSTDNRQISVDDSELSGTEGTRDNRATPLATFSPLEEAGTYIQRQKRAERDAVVAQTQVDIEPIASANNNAVPVQNDSRVTQPQPNTTTDTTASQPATTTQAVPALW